jgi:hypothetical protein
MNTFAFDPYAVLDTPPDAATVYFVHNDTDAAGYVTIERSGQYTIERFVDEENNTVDYMFDRSDAWAFDDEIMRFIDEWFIVDPIDNADDSDVYMSEYYGGGRLTISG